MSGYFGIGVYHPKNEVNVGTLWRSAWLYGADFIFTIGRRYRAQCSDTVQAPARIPLWTFADYADFHDHLPYAARLVCVEMVPDACALPDFPHWDRAVYLLGAEDHGLPKSVTAGQLTVQIPCARTDSMNVAVAGTLVLYDRWVKQAA